MVPHGFEPKVNPKDPRIPALREFAHKHHLSQEAVSALIGLDLQAQVADQMAADEAIQAEMKALGENGKARIAAVERGLAAPSRRSRVRSRAAVHRQRGSGVGAGEASRQAAGAADERRLQNNSAPPRPADRLYGQKG